MKEEKTTEDLQLAQHTTAILAPVAWPAPSRPEVQNGPRPPDPSNHPSQAKLRRHQPTLPSGIQPCRTLLRTRGRRTLEGRRDTRPGRPKNDCTVAFAQNLYGLWR